MDKSLCSSLITWLRTFPGHANLTASSLTDGVAMGTILHRIAPEYFSEKWLAKVRTDVADNWRLKVSNLKKVYQGVTDYFYFSELPGQTIRQFPTPDINKIVEHEDEIELGRLLQLILGCAINCEQKQQHIEAIMGMEEGVQALIVNAIQDLMNRETTPGSPEVGGAASPSGAWLGPASFHPQIKTLVEQLESTSLAKEDMTKRCNELDLQITILSEDKKTLSEENEKLLERVEVLESGGDIGAQSFRYKDLRKQVDTLQGELYKVESSRDEYRSRVDGLERENKEVTARNEELQRLADESRSLKDEVDALRDMSERVAVYEGTVETYKKKLEELSDLKRQVKILEEKNSEYMHQNMELEEEVKKSGTWRPQLDLYKKQVSELHQKLAEEAKKTDRQIFENKKLMEKLEALTQEKERLALERDMLKENVEELKCTVSALSSPDTASRPPSDLSDLDTLEIIPPEIREKLVRLQHENRLLKQKASEQSSESAPVLQSLLNDLQERHDKLLQENRWEKLSPPSPPPSSYSSPQWPPLGRMWPLDAYFMLDSTLPRKPSKLKVLKRNLKWASESDLLILRQPQHTNFLSNFLYNPKRKGGGSPLNKSLTLPPPRTGSPLPKKDSPIVIHHIHEFKMAPSPTNEDSGCCRTSPSSCEGCEDHRSSGSYGIRTPDYANTLDSGVSGMFRCLSPVIPSIVEECTTHHISDIYPAVLSQEGGAAPPVMYHTHPTHSISSSSPSTSTTNTHANLNPNHAHQHTCFCYSPSKSSCEASEPGFSKPSSPHQTTFISTPFSPSNHPLSYSQHDGNSERNLPVKASTSHPPTQPSLSESAIQTSCRPSSTLPPSSSPPSSSLPIPPRKQSASSLPQRPDPPDSPTPHNSPRLPQSIHHNRTKTGKTALSASPSQEEPRSRDRAASSPPAPKEGASQRRIPVKEGRRDSSQKRPSKSNGSPPQPASPAAEKTRQPRPKPPYLETDLDLAFPHRFRASSKESSLDRLTGRIKTGILNKVRSKSLDKYRSRPDAKLSIPREVHAPSKEQLPPLNTCLRDPPRPKAAPRLSDSKSESRVERMRYASRGSDTPSAATAASPAKEQHRRSWGFENSLLYKSLRDSKFLSLSPTPPPPPTSDPATDKKRSRSETSSRRGSVASADGKGQVRTSLSKGDGPAMPSSLPLSTTPSSLPLPNGTSSKDERRSRVPKGGGAASGGGTPSVASEASSSRRRPTSSRESLSASSHSSKSKRHPEVTLLTDTLFTHFVVSPKKDSSAGSHARPRPGSTPSSMSSLHSFPLPLLTSSSAATSSRRSRDSVPLLSDTDTDLELVENRLVSSGYGAPLVSSESCTSILHSEHDDFDPSATDYFSEAEMDFNPRQYKLLTLQDNKAAIRASSPENGRTNLPVAESLIVPSSQPGVRSNGYFAKKKNQMIMASKNKILNGGIVKVKNKTAKAVVAETFNAVFTFCTP